MISHSISQMAQGWHVEVTMLSFLFAFRGLRTAKTHLNKKDEVFEGGVEMGLFLQLDHGVKVLVVNVSVDAEQPLQDRLCH